MSLLIIFRCSSETSAFSWGIIPTVSKKSLWNFASSIPLNLPLRISIVITITAYKELTKIAAIKIIANIFTGNGPYALVLTSLSLIFKSLVTCEMLLRTRDNSVNTREIFLLTVFIVQHN